MLVSVSPRAAPKREWHRGGDDLSVGHSGEIASGEAALAHEPMNDSEAARKSNASESRPGVGRVENLTAAEQAHSSTRSRSGPAVRRADPHAHAGLHAVA
jgi:hypothetical protein